MTRWAFIGAGAMAGAMIQGLIARRVAAPPSIACIGGNDPTAENLSRATGVRAAASFEDLLEGADVLIAACKPQNLADLPPALAGITAGKLVVSILAGTRLARLAGVFPRARNIVRVMPNTPAQIGAGISGWCAHAPLADEDRATLLSLLEALGKTVAVAETDMDAVTAVSGSGPAYVFEFVAALREAAVANGLSPEVAAALVEETVLGAVRLLGHTGTPPDVLRDRVTSPNGTTAAALRVFGERRFRQTILDAVTAAARRSVELSGG
jgi:pyrroline-5-carboxylate reductase